MSVDIFYECANHVYTKACRAKTEEECILTTKSTYHSTRGGTRNFPAREMMFLRKGLTNSVQGTINAKNL